MRMFIDAFFTDPNAAATMETISEVGDDELKISVEEVCVVII